MAYRDDQKCHICGEETRLICPGCQDAVCEAHSLAARMQQASGQQLEAAERLARRLGSADMCAECMAEELATSSGPFVEVVRLTDPVTAEMLVAAMLERGLDARALGTHNAALLGAGDSIFEQRIEVPEAQAAEAEALARDLLETADLDGAAEREDDEEEALAPAGPTGLSPRRRGIAAGLCCIFPGGGHYYVRRPWTGAMLTALFLLSLVLLFGGAGRAGAAAFFGVPALDMAGSQAILDAVNRGERASLVSQLARGFMLVAAALAVAFVLR